MHYTPIGSPQTDRRSLALVFMDKADVTHYLHTAGAINSRFSIPPHEARHRVESEQLFRYDSTMISLFPHMHMRGKSFRYELTYPDGKKEILLDVPSYDFNWQTSYVFQEPKRIPKGSRLHCTAIFDDSVGNLANPNPNKTIRWGQQTWDEMMIGWYDLGVPLPARKPVKPGQESD